MKKFIALFIVAMLVVPAMFVFASAETETITIDGNLNDNGWDDSRWVTVDAEDGVYQAEPTTSDAISFKYQARMDATKIYFAVIFTEDFVATPDDAVEGNGNGTNIRLWIHNGDSTYLTYTHFYDVYRRANGDTNTGSFYNTNPTGNAKAAIASSSIKAKTGFDGEQYFAEFSIDRSEFDGEDDFTYFLAISSKINENVCLFFPKITLDPDNRLANFPYRDWEHATAGEANDDILLGEISEETSEPAEETSEPADTYEDDIVAAMGDKNEDAQFDLIVDAPETYKAGENVDITVTIKNITAENGLAILDFSFIFDDDKLENINEVNKDNSLACTTTLPGGEDTAWENLTNSTITDGTINVSVGVADDPEQVAKNDGDLVFTFSFKVKEDATGKIGAFIPHESAVGQDAEFSSFNGNGSYDIMVEGQDDVTSEPADETSEPAAESSVADETSTAPTGDSGMSTLVLAVIAVVAIAGSAIIIRSRN